MLYFERSADDAIIDLLKENVVGSPRRSMLYRHTNIERKINHIKEAYYVSIKHNGKALSNICFICRTDKDTDYFYIRFLTFKGTLRRKVEFNYKSKESRISGVKKTYDPLVEGKWFTNYNVNRNIIYSYIDPGNIRSLDMAVGFGFKSIRSFSTFLFSRFFPKKSNNVRKIEKQEIPGIRQKLKEQYKDYNFFNFDNVFIEDNYFVLECKGIIIAGLQVHPEKWKVLDLPGFSGKILLNVVSRLPFFSKLFGREYSFLGIEGLYHLNGTENRSNELIEGVLNIKGYNTAMLPIDLEGELYQYLKSTRFGILNAIQKPVKTNVVVRFNGLTDADQEKYYNKPVYISSYDIS